MYGGLDFFIEGDGFVEYQGEMYYVGDDVGGKELEGFEFVDGEVELSSNLNLRRNVGFGGGVGSGRYVGGYDLGDKGVRDCGLRVESDGGVLGDSGWVILKRIVGEVDVENKLDHVLYNKDKGCYYCVKNGCDDCDVVLDRVKNDRSVVSLDIASQEPLVSSILSRESAWVDVFRLKSFDRGFLRNLRVLFAVELGIGEDDDRYIGFVHDVYYFDRSDIYRLNYLVSCVKKDRDVWEERLLEFVGVIVGKFKDYEGK